ncbi:hypothetical protein [Sabulicella glaciei]|uniref:hypothetical protein n=1 Tax=Sabulicella glaciei TaxID=2984948 RepID=UPI002658BBF3|nr:hypothetical protein [Roseococcus sp. MDT2-1-1]
MRARLVYVTISCTLYFLLVLAGRPILDALGIGAAQFPPAAWPLTIALLMVGVLPNPNMKWLNSAEDRLRRHVHAWFLVPDGVKETIAVLQDAAYTPPQAQLEAVKEPLRSRIREGLALPRTELRYRWARASMLMEAIHQIGNGAPHPLASAGFQAFQEDLVALRQRYRALRSDIDTSFASPPSEEVETALREQVDGLLQRIYAYLSWGVRHQAQSDRIVFAKLVECGFRVPVVDQGRRSFDVIAPALLLVMALVFVMNWIIDATSPQWAVSALASTVAAGLMYGGSSLIVLRRRAQMIEATTWDPASPRSLVGLAWRAGLATWAVIVAVTVFFGFEAAVNSLTGLWSAAVRGSDLDEAALWFPSRVATAAPWFLVGASFSVLLASRLDGDVRRVTLADRARDAAVAGIGLALAVVAASIIQEGLEAAIRGAPSPATVEPFLLPGTIGLLVGGIMGFVLPKAFRREIMRPARTQARLALRELMDRAKQRLGEDAEAWAFTRPEEDTDIRITPAEALRYRSHATGVWALLDQVAAARGSNWQPSAAAVIDGGRKAG